MKYFKMIFCTMMIFLISDVAAAFKGQHELLKIIESHVANGIEMRGASVTLGTENPECKSLVPYGFPKTSADTAKSSVFTCRIAYGGQFDNDKKVPLWIIEHITRDSLVGDGDRDDIQFRKDPQVSTSPNGDAMGGCWQRGHMAPAADFKYSQAAMDQSFLMTNIVPQNNDHNMKIWADLEGAIRLMTKRRGELYVVTGPAFSGKITRLNNGQAIPTALWKVIVDPVAKSGTAFLIPNDGGLGDDPAPYQTSIREVEKTTGINFNPNLNRQESDALETTSDWVIPKFRTSFKVKSTASCLINK